MRDGICPEQVCITVPEDRQYAPEILPHPDGSCGVIKDSGDDPDITRGMEIVARVELLPGDGEIRFCAGDGVGVVTEDGLKVPKGEPAINPVPRQMIEAAVRSVFGGRAALVTISIPGGREIAKRTFNPRLGIQGGLSVLGTSGVVRPMSEKALKDALYAELRMRVLQGRKHLIFTFGNQGERALHGLYPELCVVQVSNEIGFMLDSALELGVEHLLIGGHPGKMTKISAGLMQTHSHTGDARREAIVTHLALMGAPVGLMNAVYECVTTDAAMALIHDAGCDAVWDRLARAAQRYCRLRVRGGIRIDTVIADAEGRLLGKWMEDDQ